LKSDVSQAKMALERTKRQANANIVQASAQLQAKLAEYDQEKNKLAKLDDQIGKAKIYAKMDGLVVYATSVRMDATSGREQRTFGSGTNRSRTRRTDPSSDYGGLQSRRQGSGI
jgi:phosphopantetheine adenylyltransferase